MMSPWNVDNSGDAIVSTATYGKGKEDGPATNRASSILRRGLSARRRQQQQQHPPDKIRSKSPTLTAKTASPTPEDTTKTGDRVDKLLGDYVDDNESRETVTTANTSSSSSRFLKSFRSSVYRAPQRFRSNSSSDSPSVPEEVFSSGCAMPNGKVLVDFVDECREEASYSPPIRPKAIRATNGNGGFLSSIASTASPGRLFRKPVSTTSISTDADDNINRDSPSDEHSEGKSPTDKVDADSKTDAEKGGGESDMQGTKEAPTSMGQMIRAKSFLSRVRSTSSRLFSATAPDGQQTEENENDIRDDKADVTANLNGIENMKIDSNKMKAALISASLCAARHDSPESTDDLDDDDDGAEEVGNYDYAVLNAVGSDGELFAIMLNESREDTKAEFKDSEDGGMGDSDDDSNDDDDEDNEDNEDNEDTVSENEKADASDSDDSSRGKNDDPIEHENEAGEDPEMDANVGETKKPSSGFLRALRSSLFQRRAEATSESRQDIDGEENHEVPKQDHIRSNEDWNRVQELQNIVSALAERVEESEDKNSELEAKLIVVQSENQCLRDEIFALECKVKARDQELTSLRLEELEGLSGGFRDAARTSRFLRIDAEEWRRLHAERDTALMRAGELAYQLADTKAKADDAHDRLIIAEKLAEEQAKALQHLGNEFRKRLGAPPTIATGGEIGGSICREDTLKQEISACVGPDAGAIPVSNRSNTSLVSSAMDVMDKVFTINDEDDCDDSLGSLDDYSGLYSDSSERKDKTAIILSI